MADGDMAELRRWIADLEAMQGFASTVAPDAAEAMRLGLTKTIGAGQDPYGRPHELTREGEAPLTGAARDMTVTTFGPSVLVRLSGIGARHHFGSVRGKRIRRLIPTDRVIPSPIVADMKRRFEKRFEEATRG